MKKILFLSALVFACPSARAAGLTVEQSKLTLGEVLFYSMPTGDAGDALKGSLGFGVYGDYAIQDNIKVGLETGYIFGYDVKGGSSDKVTVFNIGPTAKYFITQDKVTYYGVAGLGMYRSSFDAGSSTDLGLSLGGGATCEFDKNWAAGAELRYTHVGGDFDSDFINLGFKLDYKF